jgi:hypothetical protein
LVQLQYGLKVSLVPAGKAMTGRAKGGGGQHEHPWRKAPWVIAALILLLPLVAMPFTDEVVWDETDFIVAGAMLFGACGAWELAQRAAGNMSYRAGVGVAIITALILVWMNLAVGVIGSEDNPANLMYAGVLAVGIVGSLMVGFRPHGMAQVLAAMALAQAMVGAVALLTGSGSDGANWPGAIVCLTIVFAGLWLVSAWLFRKAARERIPAGTAP